MSLSLNHDIRHLCIRNWWEIKPLSSTVTISLQFTPEKLVLLLGLEAHVHHTSSTKMKVCKRRVAQRITISAQTKPVGSPGVQVCIGRRIMHLHGDGRVLELAGLQVPPDLHASTAFVRWSREGREAGLTTTPATIWSGSGRWRICTLPPEMSGSWMWNASSTLCN